MTWLLCSGIIHDRLRPIPLSCTGPEKPSGGVVMYMYKYDLSNLIGEMYTRTAEIIRKQKNDPRSYFQF